MAKLKRASSNLGWWKLLGIITLLLFVANIALLLWQLDKKQIIDSFAKGQRQQGIVLSLASGQTTIQPGEETTVSVMIDSAIYQVVAAQVIVAFAADKVDVLDITAGTFLPIVFIPGSVSGNTATITLGAQPASPPSGRGVLANIRVRARPSASGTTYITLDPNTQVLGLGDSTISVSYPKPLRLSIRNR